MIIQEGFFSGLGNLLDKVGIAIKTSHKILTGDYSNSNDMLKSLAEATNGVFSVKEGDLVSTKGNIRIDFNESYTTAKVITPYGSTDYLTKSDFVETDPKLEDIISYYKYVSHLYDILKVIAEEMPDQELTVADVLKDAESVVPNEYVAQGNVLKSNDNTSVIITGSEDSYDLSVKVGKTSVSGDYKSIVSSHQIAKELESSAVAVTLEQLIPLVKAGLRISPDPEFYKNLNTDPQDNTNTTEDESSTESSTEISTSDLPKYISNISAGISELLSGTSNIDYDESSRTYTLSGEFKKLPDKYRRKVLSSLSEYDIEWDANTQRTEGGYFIIDGYSLVNSADMKLQVQDKGVEGPTRKYKLSIKEDNKSESFIRGFMHN